MERIEKFKLVYNTPESLNWKEVTLKRGDTIFYDKLQKSMGIERIGRKIELSSENSPYCYASIDGIDSPTFMRMLFLTSALTGLKFKEKEKYPGDPIIEFTAL